MKAFPAPFLGLVLFLTGLFFPTISPAQIPSNYYMEWDPAGSLSGSWADESHFHFDAEQGYVNSPWVWRFYDEDGLPFVDEDQPRPLGSAAPWYRQPAVGGYDNIVFFRLGTYTVALDGAWVSQVYVTDGSVTLLGSGENFFTSIQVGTASSSASLTLDGTGEYGMNHGLVLADSLLTIGGSTSVQSAHGFQVAAGGALHLTGAGSLDYGSYYSNSLLDLSGTALVDQSAVVDRVRVNEGGFLSLEGNATSVNGLEVLGQAVLRGSSQQEGWLDVAGAEGLLLVEENARLRSTYTSISSGARIELDSTADIQSLGQLHIDGDGSLLELKRGPAIALTTDEEPAVRLEQNGRLVLHAETLLAVSGNVEIGVPEQSFWWPASSGTLELQGGIVQAQDSDAIMDVRGEVIGHGMIVGFGDVNFIGGGSYRPDSQEDIMIIAADRVLVGDASSSSSPVSEIHAGSSFWTLGQLQILAGGLVDVDGGILTAENIQVGGQSFKEGLLRSSGSIFATSAEEEVGQITIDAYGRLEASGLVFGGVVLQGGQITATGDLVIGHSESGEGFRMTGGTLDVGAHGVVLAGSDGAEITGGKIQLSGGTLTSLNPTNEAAIPVIHTSGNTWIEGHGTIGARLLAGGTTLVSVSSLERLTLDTSAEIFQGAGPSHIHFLDVGFFGEFLHNAGFDRSIVTVDWLSLDYGDYAVSDGMPGSHLALQPGGGIMGRGGIYTEVRGAGVSVDMTGRLYLESASLTDAEIRVGAESLTYRYDLSLNRSSITLEGGEIRPVTGLSTGGASAIELTQSTVSGHGLIRAELPILSQGSKFISSGGTLVIDSDLTGNGVLLGDVQVNGSVIGSDTGYAIPDLLVLSDDAIVFGQGQTTFEAGINFGNRRRLSAANGARFGTGAVVEGSGTVAGNVVNAGRIDLGNSPGSLIVEGNLTLESTSRIVMKLGGTVPGIDYDWIHVDGDLIYGGELVLTLAGPVHAGDWFQLFTSGGSMSGSFASVAFEESGYAGSFDAQTGRLSVTASPSAGDEDGNGLPDDWEIQHFGAVGTDPQADADGDGTSNMSEYIAGTDPRDASSLFRCEIFQEGSEMVLRVKTVVGRRYRLLAKGNLAGEAGTWTEIDALDGDGQEVEWTPDLNVGGGRQFYLVEASLPPLP